MSSVRRPYGRLFQIRGPAVPMLLSPKLTSCCAYVARKYELRRRNYFSRRTLPIWNSLPDSVVTAKPVYSFKSRHKFCSMHDFIYDYRADPLAVKLHVIHPSLMKNTTHPSLEPLLGFPTAGHEVCWDQKRKERVHWNWRRILVTHGIFLNQVLTASSGNRTTILNGLNTGVSNAEDIFIKRSTPCLKKNCASIIFWITPWNVGQL